VLLQLFQKSWSKEAWPAIQLSPEEDLAFHAQPNAVNVYKPREFAAGKSPFVCYVLALCVCMQTHRVPGVQVGGSEGTISQLLHSENAVRHTASHRRRSMSMRLQHSRTALLHIGPENLLRQENAICAAGVLRKLHLKGLGGFAVAPGGGPHLAAYVPEAKGSPGARLRPTAGLPRLWHHCDLQSLWPQRNCLCRLGDGKADNLK